MKIKTALCFDDVQLLDGHSEVKSRSEIPLNVDGIGLPIMSAAMDSIASVDVAKTMIRQGAIFIDHRNQPVYSRQERMEQALSIKYSYSEPVSYGFAIGLKDDSLEVIEALEVMEALRTSDLSIAANYLEQFHIVLDVASANNSHVLDYVEEFFEELIDSYTGNLEIIKFTLGNCSNSASLLKALEERGMCHLIDYIKVSQGGGSMCSTRTQIGVGKPTFQAIIDCCKDIKRSGKCIKVIADGGIKTTGDMAKAFAAGASIVMVGGMIAGHSECPGQIKMIDGVACIEYRGMASARAKLAYLGHSNNIEGGSTYKKLKATSLKGSMDSWIQNLQSAVGTCGFSSLKDMIGNGNFIRVTSAGVGEAQLHGTEISK